MAEPFAFQPLDPALRRIELAEDAPLPLHPSPVFRGVVRLAVRLEAARARRVARASALRAVWLTAFALLAAAPAAAVPGDPFDLRAVCRDDFRRHCTHLGGDATRAEVLRCLEQHERELSPACRIAVGEERGGADDPRGPGRAVR